MAQIQALEQTKKETLECFQTWIAKEQDILLERKKVAFLPGLEEPMYYDSKGLDDFVAVQAPLEQRDQFQESLSHNLYSLYDFVSTIGKEGHTPLPDILGAKLRTLYSTFMAWRNHAASVSKDGKR
jgi:hypothetical protein